jgi:hypothetical protein
MSELSVLEKKNIIDNVDFNGLILWTKSIELANKDISDLCLKNKSLRIILDRQMSAIKGLKATIVASKPVMED